MLPAGLAWAAQRSPDPPSEAVREVLALAPEVRLAWARRLRWTATDVVGMEHALFEPLGPVELGRRVHLTSAAATLLVDRLERAGHVRREPHCATGDGGSSSP